MAKKKQFVTAAAAFAVAASAVAPAITADAASTTVQLASDYVRGGDLDAALDKEYKGSEIYWYKSSVDMNKLGVFQTAKGFVKGQGIRVEKKLRVLNHAQDIQPEEIVLEEGVPASGLRIQPVLFADGVKYNKVVTYKGFSTEKAGEFEGTFTYSNKAFGVVTKTVKYKVVATKVELSEVKSEVMDDVLSVTADVKNLKDGEKVELVVYANRDMNAALPAVQAEVKDGKLTVKSGKLPAGNHSFILRSGEVKTDVMNFVVEAPMVKDVKAINATQLEVSFNKAVNKTAAETATKYSINNVNPSSVSLSEDGMTATLTFASAAQVEVTNGVVVVDPIVLASDVDKSTAKYTKVLTFEDTVKPEIAGVVAKTSGTVATELTVTTSEPIQSSLAKVNGTYYTVTFSGKTGTITGLSLEANKAHTIELINLTDLGGNVTVQTSKTFNVSVDAVAPTVSLAAQGDNDIVLTFNKPMDVATVVAALGSNAVKDELLGNVAYTGPVAAVAGSNDTKFVIDVTGALYANKDSRTLSVVLPGTMKDKLGNSFVAGTQAVTLVKDAAKPVATDFKIVKNSQGQVTSLEVYFNEALALNATPALPTIVNENGVAVSAASFLGGLNASAVAAGDKKVVYTATTPAALSGKYAFSFAAGLVSDQAQTANTSAAFNHTFDFGAANAGTFTLTSAAATGSNTNVIAVNFGKAVKGGAVANSATDVANYSLGGKPLPAGTSITLDGTQNIATITLPAESIVKTDATTIFTVANVVALDGSKLNSYNGTVQTSDNVKPVLSSALLNSDDTLTVGFSEALAGVAPVQADFVVTLNGTDVPLSATNATVTAGTGLNAGKYVVTVDEIASDASGLFYDVDRNGTRDAGEVALTSIKFSTSATPTAADAANNVLKASTTITVK